MCLASHGYCVHSLFVMLYFSNACHVCQNCLHCRVLRFVGLYYKPFSKPFFGLMFILKWINYGSQYYISFKNFRIAGIFNSRPHLLSRLLLRSYFFLLRQTFFRFTILPLFRHFARNLFDFSRLVSLFSHCAKSEFEHHLLSKAIQNEQSRYKKLKSEIETG